MMNNMDERLENDLNRVIRNAEHLNTCSNQDWYAELHHLRPRVHVYDQFRHGETKSASDLKTAPTFFNEHRVFDFNWRNSRSVDANLPRGAQ